MAHKKNYHRSKPETISEFLVQLECTGNVLLSCENVNVPRRTIYNWLNKDPRFKEKFNASYDIGVELLVDEAQRRAFHGTMEPVYHLGKVVGYINKYSDRLLEFLIKGQRRETFGDKTELTGKDGKDLMPEVKQVITINGKEIEF